VSPRDFSGLSLWSEDSFLSIASKGSVLSVLSARARDSILGDPDHSDAGLLAAGILAACGAAIAGWAVYNRKGRPRSVR
jgi:hypothetical protein